MRVSFASANRKAGSGPSGRAARPLRRGRAALACVALALAVTSAWARIGPDEVEIELPRYVIQGPADRLNETWTYRFYWAGIPVGSAFVRVHEASETGRPILRVEVAGRTSALVDLLWAYRLQAEGFIRLEPFAPGEYHAVEVERGRRKQTDIVFDERRTVHTQRIRGDRVFAYAFAAPNTYDIVATVFLALNLDYRPGERYRFDVLTGTARYLVTVTVAGRTEIEAAGTRHDAWRLTVTSRELTDPNEEEKHRATDLWVSAARPRRLLAARSKTFVGAITGRMTARESKPPSSP